MSTPVLPPLAGLTRRQALTWTAAAMATAVDPAFAQLGSGAPLRVIVPGGPASGIDLLARAGQSAMGREFDRAVVIENLTGAGGTIGTAQLAKAAPDGSTIGFIGNNHAVNPSLYKNIPFDSVNDITPISVIGAGRFLMVVNPKRLPVHNALELQKALLEKPDFYNYASSGNGTIIHLAAAMYLHAAGVTARHVPYKTMGQMTNDIAGGQVDFGVLSGTVARPQLESGALRAVGVMGHTRHPGFPNVATMMEQGFRDVDVSAWTAVIAPKGLSSDKLKLLHTGIVNAWKAPEVQQAMARMEFSVSLTSPEEAARFIKAEVERYARIVRAQDIRAG